MATMLTLGDVILEPQTLNGFERKREFAFAVHDVVDGKPGLQWMGPGLIGTSLQARLSARFGSVADRLAKLEAAAAKGAPLAASWSDGTALGQVVIAGLDDKLVKAAADGTPIVLDVMVRLMEAPDAGAASKAPTLPRSLARSAPSAASLATSPSRSVSSLASKAGVPLGDATRAADEAASAFGATPAEAGRVLEGAAKAKGVSPKSLSAGLRIAGASARTAGVGLGPAATVASTFMSSGGMGGTDAGRGLSQVITGFHAPSGAAQASFTALGVTPSAGQLVQSSVTLARALDANPATKPSHMTAIFGAALDAGTCLLNAARDGSLTKTEIAIAATKSTPPLVRAMKG